MGVLIRLGKLLVVSAMLALAGPYPAHAAEVTGTVKSVNFLAQTFTLTSGHVFVVPLGVGFPSLSEGQSVTVTYSAANGVNSASKIAVDPASVAAAAAPAGSKTVTGVVQTANPLFQTMTLTDGQTFVVPLGTSMASLAAGTTVTVTFTTQGGVNTVYSVAVAASSGPKPPGPGEKQVSGTVRSVNFLFQTLTLTTGQAFSLPLDVNPLAFSAGQEVTLNFTSAAGSNVVVSAYIRPTQAAAPAPPAPAAPPPAIAAVPPQPAIIAAPAPPPDRTPPVFEVPATVAATSETVTVGGRVTDDRQIASLRVDGQAITLGPDGRFQITRQVPVAGLSIALEATDAAGNVARQTVRVSAPPDTAPPVLETPAALVATGDTITIAGRVSDDRPGTLLRADDVAVTIGPDGRFTFTRNAPRAGVLSINVVAQDAAGNKTQRVVRVEAAPDIQAPVIDVPAALAATAETITIAGRVADDRELAWLHADGQLVPVGPDGRFQVSRPVPVTGLVVALEAQDTAGNRSQRSVRVDPAPDKMPPTFDIPANIAATADTFAVTGRVTDDRQVASLRADGQSVPIGPDGRFQITRSVPAAGLSIALEAVDVAGNRTQRTIRIEPPPDRTAPVIELPAPIVAGDTGTATIAGRVTDDRQLASLRADGQAVTVAPDGRFQFSRAVPLAGLNIVFEALDTAGNKSQKTLKVTPAADTKNPQIEVPPKLTATTDTITITGRVADDRQMAALTMDGQVIPFAPDGAFQADKYVPISGTKVVLEAIDAAGNRTQRTVEVTREVAAQVFNFPSLNPTTRPLRPNPNAIAIIIGIEHYQREPDVPFAVSDAAVFMDYARRALGVPDANIKYLPDAKATLVEIRLALRQWLPGTVRANVSDVYVYVAGHGLADEAGNQYLLPYDGTTALLQGAALPVADLLAALDEAHPRSATVFLDTCFSGLTRTGIQLAEVRGLKVSAAPTIPKNVTVISASAGTETAMALPETQHGLFSYFLMKGLEGTADKNGDGDVTIDELYAYVLGEVPRQAVRLGGRQNPSLAGDGERILVRR